MNDILEELKKVQPVLKNRYGINRIALFGSYALNMANEQSDIDILIINMDKKNGFTIAKAKRFLSEYFQREVDLGLYDSLRPFIKKQIEKEIVYV